MNTFSDTVVAFKLVWLRAAFYFLIPAATLFLTQTETYSDETWRDMGLFLRMRIVLASCIAGAVSLCAYVDASMQKAQVHAEELTVERKAGEKEEAVKNEALKREETQDKV